jgi:hypothetical protein
MPALFEQIKIELGVIREENETSDNFLSLSMRGSCRHHKEAIHNEYKRREEKKREEFRIQKEKEEEKRKLREDRAAARERARVASLRDRIHIQNMMPAQIEETYLPSMRIYDVRDPEATKDGVHFIGGLVGELLITFTCLFDYILANPQN